MQTDITKVRVVNVALYDRVAYVSGVIWIIYRADVQLSSAWITEDYFKLYYVFTFIRKNKKVKFDNFELLQGSFKLF